MIMEWLYITGYTTNKHNNRNYTKETHFKIKLLVQ